MRFALVVVGDNTDIIRELMETKREHIGSDSRKMSYTLLSADERVAAVRLAVMPMRSRFGVPVEVVRCVEDVRDARVSRAICNGDDVKGWCDTKSGKVCLYAPNIENERDARSVYMHEVIAHKGMRGLLGEERYNELCERLGAVLTGEQRQVVEEYAGSNDSVLGDEYIARVAEEMIDDRGEIKEPTVWAKIQAIVREIFRAALGLELTDADIHYMLWRSSERLRIGQANLTQRAQNVETERKLRDAVTRMRPEETDYEREVREIAERAKADGTYMRAPNGERSNLDERQWAHVRTTAFKGWFGDWELPYKKVRLVEGDLNHGFSNFSEARQWAKDNIVRVYSIEETGGKGEIRISNDAIGKFLQQNAVSKSTNVGVHLAALKVLPAVLRESIDAERHPDYKKGADGIRSLENGINPNVTIHRLYGAVDMAGKAYRVKITVKEDITSSAPFKAHSYEATKIELSAGTLGNSVNGLSPDTDNSIYVANLLKGVETSNDSSIFLLENHSKVVDGNGEPKVVFSLTDDRIKFVGSHANPLGNFPSSFSSITSDTSDATVLSHQFLNIRKPLEIDFGGRGAIEHFQIEGKRIEGIEELAAYAEQNGYDGVIARNVDGEGTLMTREGTNDEYVVFRSNQMKSARGDMGAYNRSDDGLRFAIGHKRKEDMRKGLMSKLANASDEQVERTISEIEKLGERSKQGGDSKVEKAAYQWVQKGAILLPEDADKVLQAVRMADKYKVDVSKYDRPQQLIDEYLPRQQAGERIDPDTVKTLTNKQVVGDTGITIYNVANGEQGRKDMREIINTHFGKSASPWCLLQGDGEGNLTDSSKRYWKRYSAYPKRVAFKDGKLLAFFASDDEPTWWDRQDRPHAGIPVEGKIPNDELGRYGNIEYDEDGGVRGISDLYRGNKRDGLYEEWHDQDTKRCEQHFKNGQADGICRAWYTNGRLMLERNYKEDLADGISKSWNFNGQLEAEGEYKKGKRVGIQKVWWPNGQLHAIEEYKDGKLDGLRREWHSNGKLELEQYFKNGIEDGLYRWWHPNGRLSFECNYKGGEREGIYRAWHENGQIREESHYSNGNLDCLYGRWSEKGRLLEGSGLPAPDAVKTSERAMGDGRHQQLSFDFDEDEGMESSALEVAVSEETRVRGRGR